MTELLLELDKDILLLIQALRTPAMDVVWCVYTRFGNTGLIWIVLSLGMLCFRRTRRAGILGLLGLAVGFVCCNLILKPLVGRVRPWLVVDGLAALVAEHDPHSFPSGHTCAAFAAACVWRPHLPKQWGNTALVCAALMGVSRLYVGVHFPTDVLAGALVGCLSAWAVRRVEKMLAKDRKT